jgi:hypothetical protein
VPEVEHDRDRRRPISSSASGIVCTNEKTSACVGWTARARRARRASPAPRSRGCPRARPPRRASPRPREEDARTRARARRGAHARAQRLDALLRLVRPLHERQRQDRRHRRHAVRRASPLSRSRSAAPSPSLISQTPIPSTPARRYAARSSSKLAPAS